MARDYRPKIRRWGIRIRRGLNAYIATQLNIYNGDKQPIDLIGEAVKWLKGEAPYTYGDSSTGKVDTNGNGDLQTTAPNIEYNTTTKAFTLDANGSRTGIALTAGLQAWVRNVDVDSTTANVQASGEDLKNALDLFNNDHLITVNDGTMVGYTANGVSLVGVTANVNDAFWDVLFDAGKV